MVEPGGPDDKIIKTLDVYWCNKVHDNVEMVLLQSPLRPPHRPYDKDGYTSVKWKPKNKKLQLEAPLDKNAPTYRHVDGNETMNKRVYESQHVDVPVRFAVGSIRNGCLVLTPVNTILQMRPSMRHCNTDAASGSAANAAADKADGAAPEAKEPNLVTVQVVKRENERQAAARKISWTFLQQEEAKEEWQNLTYHDFYSDASQTLWDALMDMPARAGADAHVAMDADPQGYFHAISPGFRGDVDSESSPAADAAAGASTSGASLTLPISREAEAKLPHTLSILFETHPVCSLTDIRTYLSRLPERPPEASYVEAPDAQLHRAIMATKHYLHLGRVYTPVLVKSEVLNPIRTVILEVLQNSLNYQTKKSDVQSALQERDIDFVENVYNKAMRTLCVSRGGTWTLKTGADL